MSAIFRFFGVNFGGANSRDQERYFREEDDVHWPLSLSSLQDPDRSFRESSGSLVYIKNGKLINVSMRTTVLAIPLMTESSIRSLILISNWKTAIACQPGSTFKTNLDTCWCRIWILSYRLEWFLSPPFALVFDSLSQSQILAAASQRNRMDRLYLTILDIYKSIPGVRSLILGLYQEWRA